MNTAQLTATDKDMLTAAVRIGFANVGDIIELIAVHDGDPNAILSNLDSWAEALRHTDFAKLSAWFKLRESVRFLINDDGHNDKHGFAAEAREKARVIVSEHEVRV